MNLKSAKLKVEFPTYDKLSSSVKSCINAIVQNIGCTLIVNGDFNDSIIYNNWEGDPDELPVFYMENIEGTNDYKIAIGNTLNEGKVPATYVGKILALYPRLGTLAEGSDDTSKTFLSEKPIYYYISSDKTISLTFTANDPSYTLDNSEFTIYVIDPEKLPSSYYSICDEGSCLSIPFTNNEREALEPTYTCYTDYETGFQIVSTEARTLTDDILTCVFNNPAEGDTINLKVYQGDENSPIAEANFKNNKSIYLFDQGESFYEIISGATSFADFPIHFHGGICSSSMILNSIVPNGTSKTLKLQEKLPITYSGTNIDASSFSEASTSIKWTATFLRKYELDGMYNVYCYKNRDVFPEIPVKVQLVSDDDSPIITNAYPISLLEDAYEANYYTYHIPADITSSDKKYTTINYQLKTPLLELIDSETGEVGNYYYKIGLLHKDGTDESTTKLVDDFLDKATLKAIWYENPLSQSIKFHFMVLNGEYTLSPYTNNYDNIFCNDGLSFYINTDPVVINGDIGHSSYKFHELYHWTTDELGNKKSELVGILYTGIYNENDEPTSAFWCTFNEKDENVGKDIAIILSRG